MGHWFDIGIRGYELDDEGRVPPWQVARYLEAIRWQSIKEGTHALRGMFENGHRMVVRAQQIRWEKDIEMWDQLRISLTLGRVGRASADLHHQVLRRRGTKEELVARAIVTVVHLDEHWRPTAIPDDVRQEVEEDDFGVLVPGLDAPSDPPAWERPLEIRPSDLDVFRHVNHANYVLYAADTLRLAIRRGVRAPKISGKATPRIRAASIDYRDQVVLGDQVTALLWYLEDGAEAGVALRKQGKEQPVCTVRLVLDV